MSAGRLALMDDVVLRSIPEGFEPAFRDDGVAILGERDGVILILLAARAPFVSYCRRTS